MMTRSFIDNRIRPFLDRMERLCGVSFAVETASALRSPSRIAEMCSSVLEIRMTNDRIPEIPLGKDTGEGVHSWTVRWILPVPLPESDANEGDERNLFSLPDGHAYRTPILLVRPGSETPDAPGNEPRLAFDASDSHVVSSWWLYCTKCWKRFAESVNRRASEPIQMDRIIRLEAGLNAPWTDSRARGRLYAEPLGDDSNPLLAIECERKIEINWRGEHGGEAFRRPHETHQRRICPFQTPESKRIGLSLHLAADAAWNSDSLSIDRGRQTLSIACGMIPYPNHTDGPRLLMGGKNLKQAETGIAAPEPPCVPGAIEGNVMQEIPALVDRSHHDKAWRFSPYLGKNLMVAIMPYEGFTYEDGLVIRLSAADAFRIPEYRFRLQKIFREICVPLSAGHVPDEASIRRILADRFSGLRGESFRFSTPLPSLAPLARQTEKGFENLDCGVYPFFLEGKLTDIEAGMTLGRSRGEDSGRYLPMDLELTLHFVADLPLGFGDKMTGRHGNKGVITRILEDREAPVALIDWKEIPVDLMISPCSVIGRKNLGQILEMVHGLLLTRTKSPGSFKVPSNRLLTSEEFVRLLPLLKEMGSDDSGLFKVRLADGRSVRAFVGPQYFARLHHHALRKLQARGAYGPVSSLTGLPERGGARTAQRMGEMEHWSVAGYPVNSGSLPLGEKLLFDLRKNRSGREESVSSSGTDFLRSFVLDVLRCLGMSVSTTREEHGESLSISRPGDPGIDATTERECDAWALRIPADEKGRPDVRLVCRRLSSSRTPGDVARTALGGADTPLPFRADGALCVVPSVLKCLGTEGFLALRRFTDALYSCDAELGTGESISESTKEKLKNELKRYRGFLSSLLFGKEGVFRADMMGRRFSSSGRAVIIPHPSLRPDEVLLPCVMASEILSGAPDVARRLNLKHRLADCDTLRQAFEDSPVWVLLIRQPSLHRHSVQAFRAHLWDRPVIGIPPLVTPGFNADFDGDTMAVFLPPEPYAKDLQALSILENPGLVGTGEIAFASGLDLALGWHNMVPDRKKAWIDRLKPEDRTPEKTEKLKGYLPLLIRELADISSNARGEILRELQMDLCSASTGAASIPPLDFERLASLRLSDTPVPVSEEEGNTAKKNADKRIDSALRRFGRSDISVLVKSGAKGDPDGLRNMTAFLGHQEVYSKDRFGEDVWNDDTWIKGNLWRGLTDDELFRFSSVCRDVMTSKKLSVAGAGYLTRLLAEGLFETAVTQDDCGATKGLSVSFDDGRLSIRAHDEVIPFPSSNNTAADLERLAWGRVPTGLNTPLSMNDLQAILSFWGCGSALSEGARNNDLIDHLERNSGVLRLRSPLFCTTPEPGLCRACCGADISGKPYDRMTLPPIGTHIGVNVAQAIGERGTQLAMKRFHNVGSEDAPIEELKSVLLSPSDQAIDARLRDLLTKVLSESESSGTARKDLPQQFIHYEIALRDARGLRRAALARGDGDILARLAYEQGLSVLGKIAPSESRTDTFTSFKSSLLWNEPREGRGDR